MTDKKRTASLDWEDVRFFTALARHGTLAAAARALKVTHATVARRLANLEAALGRPLFARGSNGFTLNATGAAALAEAAQMEMAACALAERRESSGAITGTVRITGRRVVLRANSQVAQALAARAGRGVALLPELVARSLGGLVAVPFAETPPARELWLLMRPDVARLARVRAVADHLIELLHEFRAAAEPK